MIGRTDFGWFRMVSDDSDDDSDASEVILVRMVSDNFGCIHW